MPILNKKKTTKPNQMKMESNMWCNIKPTKMGRESALHAKSESTKTSKKLQSVLMNAKNVGKNSVRLLLPHLPNPLELPIVEKKFSLSLVKKSEKKKKELNEKRKTNKN